MVCTKDGDADSANRTRTLLLVALLFLLALLLTVLVFCKGRSEGKRRGLVSGRPSFVSEAKGQRMRGRDAVDPKGRQKAKRARWATFNKFQKTPARKAPRGIQVSGYTFTLPLFTSHLLRSDWNLLLRLALQACQIGHNNLKLNSPTPSSPSSPSSSMSSSPSPSSSSPSASSSSSSRSSSSSPFSSSSAAASSVFAAPFVPFFAFFAASASPSPCSDRQNEGFFMGYLSSDTASRHSHVV